MSNCPEFCPAAASVRVAMELAAELGEAYKLPRSTDQTLGFISIYASALGKLRVEYPCEGPVTGQNNEPRCRLAEMASNAANMVTGPNLQQIAEFNYPSLLGNKSDESPTPGQYL